MVNAYIWFEIASLILIFSAFFILLKAKKRDVTRYLKDKLSGIFFLVVIFIIVFVLGAFISFLAVLALIVSFVLLLMGIVFRKKVEIRRIRIHRVIPKPFDPRIIEKEKSPEEEINKLEKEVERKSQRKNIIRKKIVRKAKKTKKKTTRKRKRR